MSKSITKTCTGEFQLKNCGFQHSPADDFVKSQWQARTKSPFYLVYRWAVVAVFIAAVTVSMKGNTTAADWGYYFIYFTNWGITICLLTTVYAAFLVTYWYFHPEYSGKILTLDQMPKSFKIYWIMHNTTIVGALVISIMYWGVLYDAETSTVDASNILVHAVNACVMFLDLLIVSYPIRLMHISMPLCLGVIYTLFGAVFYLAGGSDRNGNRYVYNVIDWSKPGSAIVVNIGVFVLMLVIHFAIFWIHHLRMFIHRRYFMTSVDFASSTETVEARTEAHDNIAFTVSNEKLDK